MTRVQVLTPGKCFSGLLSSHVTGREVPGFGDDACTARVELPAAALVRPVLLNPHLS